MDDKIKELQSQLASVDLLTRRSARPDAFELLVIKLQDLKIKMYQEPNHRLPHVHVDYNGQAHLGSYSIDPPRLMVGKVGRSHDQVISKWIAENKDALLATWQQLQAGQQEVTFDVSCK